MRLWPRKRVVLENLVRPRLGLSEGDARMVLHPRPRRDSQIAVAALGAGFKTGSPSGADSPLPTKESDSQ